MVQSRSILGARKNVGVCVLDGEPDQLALTMGLLDRAGFPALGTDRPDEAIDSLRSGGLRVILADCTRAGIDSLAFLDKVLNRAPEAYVILMSATQSVDSAIEAIKRGAFHYLCKPLEYSRLAKALDELTEHSQHSAHHAATAGQDWQPLPLSEMRRIHIHRVLETCHGNRVRAARMLGIGRTSLYRFLKSADKRTGFRASA